MASEKYVFDVVESARRVVALVEHSPRAERDTVRPF